MGERSVWSAQMETPNVLMKQVGDYAGSARLLDTTSQIQDNEEFYDVCVAFLLMPPRSFASVDAISGRPICRLEGVYFKTFIERLTGFPIDLVRAIEPLSVFPKIEQE